MGAYKCEFLRVEKKYQLNERQCQAIMEMIASHMEEEHYGASTILNIYYDSPDYRLIRASIEKPLYKEKLRLRAYGSVREDGEVFVEIKKKFNGVVYKRRESMPLVDACSFLNSSRDRTAGDSQVLREAQWMLHTHQLIPAAAISYDRSAYVDKEDPDFRVTIDRNLKGRRTELDLRYGPTGYEMLKEGEYLMEIKTAGGMPLWMCHLLDSLRVFPTTFSKYGTFYQGYIMGAEKKVTIPDIHSIRKEMIKSA